jgi:hypothetical protein
MQVRREILARNESLYWSCWFALDGLNRVTASWVRGEEVNKARARKTRPRIEMSSQAVHSHIGEEVRVRIAGCRHHSVWSASRALKTHPGGRS